MSICLMGKAFAVIGWVSIDRTLGNLEPGLRFSRIARVGPAR